MYLLSRVKMSNEWVDNLIAQIAKDHKIIISNDDPVLVAALLQKNLIERSINDQKEVINVFKEILEDHLSKSNERNEKLIASVAERLIKENKNHRLPTSIETDLVENKESRNVYFYAGFYLLGLLSGVIGLLLFNRFS